MSMFHPLHPKPRKPRRSGKPAQPEQRGKTASAMTPPIQIAADEGAPKSFPFIAEAMAALAKFAGLSRGKGPTGSPLPLPRDRGMATNTGGVEPNDAPSTSGPRPDTAALIGLSLRAARQHGRIGSRSTDASAGSNDEEQPYPTVLVDTLRRHADAGDPTCRLVLDWLLRQGVRETGPGAARSSDKGAF